MAMQCKRICKRKGFAKITNLDKNGPARLCKASNHPSAPSSLPRNAHQTHWLESPVSDARLLQKTPPQKPHGYGIAAKAKRRNGGERLCRGGEGERLCKRRGGLRCPKLSYAKQKLARDGARRAPDCTDRGVNGNRVVNKSCLNYFTKNGKPGFPNP